MGQMSDLGRKVASVLGGAVLMAGAAVAVAALPAAGGPAGAPAAPGARHLELVALAAGPGEARFAAQLTSPDGPGAAGVAGEMVTFALVGTGSMRVEGAPEGRCTTGADGRCVVAVRAVGPEGSLLLAASGDASAEVTVR